MKSTFMIYADFESILVPEDNGKQNTEELKQTNVKIMVLAFMVMITLANLLSLVKVKMLLTILLIV